MSTISYPVVPAQSAPPTTVLLNYGDTVYLRNLPNKTWIGPFTSWVQDTNPYGYLTANTQSAQAFVILNTAGSIPLDGNQLPAPVLYGDNVMFADPTSWLVSGYQNFISGDPSYLALQQLSNSPTNYQFSLLNMVGATPSKPGPTGGQIMCKSLANYPTTSTIAQANATVMYCIGNDTSNWYYVDGSKFNDTMYASTAERFEIVVANSLCGQIGGATLGGPQPNGCTSGNYACWNGKCYGSFSPALSSAAVSSISAQVCSPTASNNLEQAFCLGYCTLQAPGGKARQQCDSYYTTYCNAVWGVPNPGPGSSQQPGIIPPGTQAGYVCSCIQAAGLEIANPQCFWPLCANNAGGTYRTGLMQQTVGNNCPSACSQGIDCVALGTNATCNIAYNTFNQACAGNQKLACTTQSDCTGINTNYICQSNGYCGPLGGCNSTTTCPAGSNCDPTNSLCTPITTPAPPNAPNCSAASDCAYAGSNMICQSNGICGPSGGCTSSACPLGTACQSGLCVPLAPPPPLTPLSFSIFDQIKAWFQANAKTAEIIGGISAAVLVLLIIFFIVTRKKSNPAGK